MQQFVVCTIFVRSALNFFLKERKQAIEVARFCGCLTKSSPYRMIFFNKKVLIFFKTQHLLADIRIRSFLLETDTLMSQILNRKQKSQISVLHPQRQNSARCHPAYDVRALAFNQHCNYLLKNLIC